ncbi:MAG: hypothetical protein V9G29_05160 [Burkholderiaceae bacterium]
MKSLISILLLIPVFSSCASPSKSELDAEVKRLCAIDGGIKVYEIVVLPALIFDKWGTIKIPMKKNAKIEDDYYYQWDINYYRQGNPELSRGHFQVIRRKDEKILGESIYYGRGGGDALGPWHDSSFRCPDDADISFLKKKIFQSANKEQSK